MKTTPPRIFSLIVGFGLLLTAVLAGGCDSALEEEVYSELSPGNFLTTEKGINSALTGAYGEVQHHSGREFFFTLTELPTDILIDREGGLEALARPLMDFTWDASHPFFAGMWSQLYEAVRNANLVLGSLEQADFSEEQLVEAEARFIRAKAYVDLYKFFGPGPLFTSSDLEEMEKPRATEEEMRTFVEAELRAAAEGLPLEQDEYGRVTKGGALGVLTKFLLNTRQWEKAAAAAQDVMDLGLYALVEDRVALFDPANEQNSEFIYVTPCIAQSGGCNGAFPHVVPDNYAFEYPPGTIWGTEFITPLPFFASFHPDDERREMIITEFMNADGEQEQLADDNLRALKYQEDPNKVGSCAGNDYPEVRYADILLSRAEALNELRGPNQEAIDLVNQVRRVADVPLLAVSDFASKEEFRDHILAERGWEFYSEGKRRQDLIRHGRLIDNAQARGKNTAAPHHVRYPIPQVEVDANSAIEQNPGY